MEERIKESIKYLDEIQRKTSEYDVFIWYVKTVLKECLDKNI